MNNHKPNQNKAQQIREDNTDKKPVEIFLNIIFGYILSIKGHAISADLVDHLVTSQWRHNECDGVSNHQPQGCLLKRLFRRRSKKTPKPRVTGPCGGIHRWPANSPNKGPIKRKMFPFDDVIMKCRKNKTKKCFPNQTEKTLKLTHDQLSG